MPTIFTRIINGEIPGRFVVQDDICVAFLDVRPLARGHVLVVPRDEVDHWVDLSPEVASHLMVVAQRVGSAQRKLLSPARIGMMIAGFEVPHVHVHVVPMDSMAAMDFSNANPNPDQGDLDQLRTDLAGLLE
ncbi:MAG: HIT family protein [Acidimicrobiaceae bacterium]|nr:HIT family protein [Acidimicrobiaceae bacterium]